MGASCSLHEIKVASIQASTLLDVIFPMDVYVVYVFVQLFYRFCSLF